MERICALILRRSVDKLLSFLLKKTAPQFSYVGCPSIEDNNLFSSFYRHTDLSVRFWRKQTKHHITRKQLDVE